MVRQISSLEDLSEEAKSFLSTLQPQIDTATLVTLSGELGAGKTAFTKALANTLGVEESVTSPTFVLEKIYALPERKAFKRLIHIDAYRLKDSSELSAIGFDEAMKDTGNLIVLEWPERIQEMPYKAHHALTFEVLDSGERKIIYA